MASRCTPCPSCSARLAVRTVTGQKVFARETGPTCCPKAHGARQVSERADTSRIFGTSEDEDAAAVIVLQPLQAPGGVEVSADAHPEVHGDAQMFGGVARRVVSHQGAVEHGHLPHLSQLCNTVRPNLWQEHHPSAGTDKPSALIPAHLQLQGMEILGVRLGLHPQSGLRTAVVGQRHPEVHLSVLEKKWQECGVVFEGYRLDLSPCISSPPSKGLLTMSI